MKKKESTTTTMMIKKTKEYEDLLFFNISFFFVFRRKPNSIAQVEMFGVVFLLTMRFLFFFLLRVNICYLYAKTFKDAKY